MQRKGNKLSGDWKPIGSLGEFEKRICFAFQNYCIYIHYVDKIVYWLCKKLLTVNYVCYVHVCMSAAYNMMDISAGENDHFWVITGGSGGETSTAAATR